MTPTPAPSEIDVVVVGGGTAGCVVAGRLAEGGMRVVLLEAGPDYGERTSGRWPADLLDAASLPSSHDWGYSGVGGAGRPLPLERCRAIGGCSSHNGTTQNVGWRGDYDAWALAGSPGWDAESLRPLFSAALQRFAARSYDADEIQPFHRAVLQRAAEIGLAGVDDFDDLDGGAGAGSAPVSSTPDGVRVNAGFAYLDPVRGSGLLTVLGDARVTTLAVRGGRVSAVRFERHGREHELRAPLVVLSGGTYGTPEILLRSGIGPAEHLAELGIAPVLDLAGVGRNLHDQPTAQLEYAGSAELRVALEDWALSRPLVEEQTIVKLRSPFAEDAPYDLHLYPWVERDASLEHGWKVVVPVGLLRPRARGELRLRPDDVSANAIISTEYLGDPQDLETLSFGLLWAEEFVRGDAIRRFLDRPLLHRSDGDDPARWLLENHRHYWHPVGTCRMAPADDPLAVVDAHGRLHGLDGIRIADASVFPDVPRGTTALAVAVVGERIARFILDDRNSA